MGSDIPENRQKLLISSKFSHGITHEIICREDINRELGANVAQLAKSPTHHGDIVITTPDGKVSEVECKCYKDTDALCRKIAPRGSDGQRVFDYDGKHIYVCKDQRDLANHHLDKWVKDGVMSQSERDKIVIRESSLTYDEVGEYTERLKAQIQGKENESLPAGRSDSSSAPQGMQSESLPVQPSKDSGTPPEDTPGPEGTPVGDTVSGDQLPKGKLQQLGEKLPNIAEDALQDGLVTAGVELIKGIWSGKGLGDALKEAAESACWAVATTAASGVGAVLCQSTVGCIGSVGGCIGSAAVVAARQLMSGSVKKAVSAGLQAIASNHALAGAGLSVIQISVRFARGEVSIEEAVSSLGAVAGASLGSMAGAALGSLVPCGVATVLGTRLGSYIGSELGARAGRALGRWLSRCGWVERWRRKREAEERERLAREKLNRLKRDLIQAGKTAVVAGVCNFGLELFDQVLISLENGTPFEWSSSLTSAFKSASWTIGASAAETVTRLCTEYLYGPTASNLAGTAVGCALTMARSFSSGSPREAIEAGLKSIASGVNPEAGMAVTVGFIGGHWWNGDVSGKAACWSLVETLSGAAAGKIGAKIGAKYLPGFGGVIGAAIGGFLNRVLMRRVRKALKVPVGH